MACCCQFLNNLLGLSKRKAINTKKENFKESFKDMKNNKKEFKSKKLKQDFTGKDSIYQNKVNNKKNSHSNELYEEDSQQDLDKVNSSIFTVYPGNFVYKLSPGALEALATHLNETNTTDMFGSLAARSKVDLNDTDNEDDGYNSQVNGEYQNYDLPFQVVFNYNASF